MRVNLADRRAVAACRPDDPAVTEQARRLKDAALLDFGLRDSVVGSWLYAKCHYQIPTTAVDTAAVVASGDGVCSLLYNPEFFVRLGPAGVKFVLFHEARHLIQRHLYVDETLRADPVFVLASEVTINHVALRRLGLSRLPTVPAPDDPTGVAREAVGIDPREVHDRYTEDLRAQGLEPLPYEGFVETDLIVYRELRRMADSLAEQPVCVHLLDAETVERVAMAVLTELTRQARSGNAAAKDELLELADRADGAGERLERMWGLLGLATLRGKTQRTQRVQWWKRWLVDVLASRLRDGERLEYPKKLGAVLLALGHEPMLLRRGRERVKVVLVAFDTSGSMSDDVVEWLSTLVGQTDGVQAHWLSFDGMVMPFVPGDRVLGYGGTNFQNVVDYAEGRLTVDDKHFEEQVDAVIMVTDGYAPPVSPAEPEKWIWLITDDGDTWPERCNPPMACHRVITGDR